jgi:hypothetical protein
MALKKALSRSENRIKATFGSAYWRVMSVDSMDNGNNRIRVAAFADSEARKLALDPAQTPAQPMPHLMRGPGDMSAVIAEKTYETALPAAPDGSYATLQEQAKAAAYLYLKAHADFAGAEDC